MHDTRFDSYSNICGTIATSYMRVLNTYMKCMQKKKETLNLND